MTRPATSRMARVAIIADTHIDEAHRFDECKRILAWIADDIEAREVDAILHAGDLYERKSSPSERALAGEWLARLADLAPVLIVRGNHDAVGDLPIFQRFRHQVFVCESSGAIMIGPVAVAGLAWPRKAELVAAAHTILDGQTAGMRATAALRTVIAGLADSLRSYDGPRVLLAHAMVRGSVTSTGQPLTGCDLELGLEDLDLAGADFVALGHIHKHQAWQTAIRAPVVYPGSPRRTAFGELEPKGYVVAEISSDGTAWELVQTPAAPMLLVEAEWNGRGFEWLAAVPSKTDPGIPEEIRFRYTADAAERDAARIAAEAFADSARASGAALVKVEELVRAVARARAPEIAAARTTADKLGALWDRQPDPPSAERRRALLDRLAELEGGNQ